MKKALIVVDDPHIEELRVVYENLTNPKPKPVKPVKEDYRRRVFPVKAKEYVLGNNEPCHCKSGKKYKKCCKDKDENARYYRNEVRNPQR